MKNITFRLAWRNLWRRKRRTWLTVGAMVFSNILLVFMISLQIGMYAMMIDNTLRAADRSPPGPGPGLQGRPQDAPGGAGREAARGRRCAQGLATDEVAARASAFALVSSAERSYGLQITGVEPEFEAAGLEPSRAGQGGRFLGDLGAEEIVIGSVLARNLRVEVGDELTFIGSGRDGSFAAAVVTVVGIFESGMPDLDRSFAEVPLGFFQDVFAMDGAGTAVVIMAPGLIQVGATRYTGRSPSRPQGEDLVVHDWDALLPGLKQAIQADFISAWFMYGILIILVAFSVLNTQLMSVLERTKEFGIVLSLGVTPGRLGRLVLLESTLMGAVGLVLGVILRRGARRRGSVTTDSAIREWRRWRASSISRAGSTRRSTFIGLLLGPMIILISSIVGLDLPGHEAPLARAGRGDEGGMMG